MSATDFDVYDTTLRDGAQQEGINLTVADKLAIAPLLDQLGVTFIEGGWPGAIPKDTEFFARAAKELELSRATLVAFGATRKAGGAAASDEQVRALLDAETAVITLVAKSDIRHVERALRTDGAENLRMIEDTVAFLTDHGRRVIVDAEHFFDGYRFDAEYSLSALRAALDSGAEVAVMCDTNGGMLPGDIASITEQVAASLSGVGTGKLGIHCHNDTGCAVANTLAAVGAGARHAQGTVNGYGERTGNANLLTIIANLVLKLGIPVVSGEQLAEMSSLSHQIAEIANIPPHPRQPYTGASAFAHKAGLHASAIRVDPDLYQHIDPREVGNDMRMLVSDMAGRASIELKGRELGFDLAGQGEATGRIAQRVKAAEAEGYTYDAADASFELLLRDELGDGRPRFFDVESWRVIVETEPGDPTDADAEATVKLRVGGQRVLAMGEGNGPLNALDAALREALIGPYPQLANLELIDFKVRILDSSKGTDAITRVLIETKNGHGTWRTVGVGPNVVEASWEALVEAYVFGLLKAGATA